MAEERGKGMQTVNVPVRRGAGGRFSKIKASGEADPPPAESVADMGDETQEKKPTTWDRFVDWFFHG